MKNATLGLPLHVIAARARPFIDRSRHRLIYFHKRGVASFPQFSKIFFRNACNPVIFENLAIQKFLRIRYLYGVATYLYGVATHQ